MHLWDCGDPSDVLNVYRMNGEEQRCPARDQRIAGPLPREEEKHPDRAEMHE
jgi:hypothetical protein